MSSLIVSKGKLSSETDIAGGSIFDLSLFQALRRLQQDAEVHAKRLARFGG